jgi:hypothetical protein
MHKLNIFFLNLLHLHVSLAFDHHQGGLLVVVVVVVVK